MDLQEYLEQEALREQTELGNMEKVAEAMSARPHAVLASLMDGIEKCAAGGFGDVLQRAAGGAAAGATKGAPTQTMNFPPERVTVAKPKRRRTAPSGSASAKRVLRGLRPPPSGGAGMRGKLLAQRRAQRPRPAAKPTMRALSQYKRTGEGVPMSGALKRSMKASRTGVLFGGTTPPPKAPPVAAAARKKYPSMMQHIVGGFGKKLRSTQQRTDAALLGSPKPPKTGSAPFWLGR